MFDLPISIVAGYLGSGKTTYINRRLNNSGSVRFGVLVNDFGSLNVDAELIEASDGVMVALENGCVCCSMEGGMEQAADQLRAIAQNIDWVLLEASGVADPTRLKDRVLSWPEFELKETLTLVDATRIKQLTQDKFIGGHIRKQLEEAENFIITKQDLMSSDQLPELQTWLQQQRVRPSFSPEARPPRFLAEKIEFDEPQSKQTLETWLNNLDESTLRLKGFVQLQDQPNKWHLVQWVDQQWTITPHTSSKPNQTGLVRISAAPRSRPNQINPKITPELAR